MSGCSGDIGLFEKFEMICGIYDMYIVIYVNVVNLLINFRYLICLGFIVFLLLGYLLLLILYLINNYFFS